MEIELAKDLMKLFFRAPAANGILVFEDNDYLGVILKRDIEIGIAEGNFNLFENINMIRVVQLPQILFKSNTSRNLQVPVIDKAGSFIRIISYEEFMSQFFFEEYLNHFKIQNVFENLEHPLVITNHFKKTLFANKQALELIKSDIEGKNFCEILKQFEIKKVRTFLWVEKGKNSYQLIVSHSESKNFSYYVYLFLKV